MASSLTPARRGRAGRRVLLTLVAAGGVVLAPLPAAAAPEQATTSQQAAALVAARAHDLEVLTEKFNDAREAVTAKQAEAATAAAQVATAEAAVTVARQQVREVARSAYTGDRLSTLQAMLSSSSADEMLDRVGTLGTIADHDNELLGAAQQATERAAAAKVAADKAAADAQALVDQVVAQQDDLNKQIADYQAQYDRLNAAEQEASRAQVERAHAAEAAAGSSSPSDPVNAVVTSSVPVVAGSGAGAAAVNRAMAQLGKPYIWAAAGPGSFDCSGLVQFAYAAAGVGLPHSSGAQARMGRAVSRDQLQPGDIIAFFSPVSHVGIYVGNGLMVHAPTSGDVVKIASIDAMGRITAMRHLG
jgi:cell wall-associated NlpC family hydrolase